MCSRVGVVRGRGGAAAIAFAAVLLAGVVAYGASPIATFSIVGYDEETGDLGVAVQSKFFAVGSVVPWAKADVGAIATQAFGNTSFGPRGLDLLEAGLPVDDVLAELLGDDPDRERRQVGILNARGAAAAFTGSECMAWAGHRIGAGYTAQGNILVSEETVAAMAAAFEASEGLLADRLIAALRAGQAAGGDSRGVQSAAILVVRRGGGYGGFNDRYCDLRVDDHEDPIEELARLVCIWKEQALILEGYRYAESGAWSKAIEAGLEAVALEPEKGEPRYHLACYYAKAGRYEEALGVFGKAVAIDTSLAVPAAGDPDLDPLRLDERFLDAIGPKSAPPEIVPTPTEIDTLVAWMSGSFSSRAQAGADTAYLDIRLEMHPIWPAREGARWLYVEQAVAGHTDRPYRQRVYGITKDGEIYRSAVYELPGPGRFAGAWSDGAGFERLTPDSLLVREGCDVLLRRVSPNAFAGSTEEGACPSTLRGASTATSVVKLERGRLMSWDRGLDADGAQVWGATAGGYLFKRE